MRLPRSLIFALAALILAGCNMAGSDAPLIAAAGASAPVLREGVWIVADDRCGYRKSRPFGHWPACANWAQIKAGQIQRYNPGAAVSWRIEPYLIAAAGELAIGQVDAGPGAERRYSYFAMRVTKFNKRGEAESLAVWPVLCGPPVTGFRQNAMVGRIMPTEQPFNGMTLDNAGEDCFARDAASLKAAAIESEAMVTPVAVRWSRSFGA
ncbi:hypothetical protein BH11PSE2_BH11PSE2_15420 [soil metagenome]